MAKNIERYNKSVDILVQAYFDDELIHGDCSKCAVGNLIKGNGYNKFKDVAPYAGTPESFFNSQWLRKFSLIDGIRETIVPSIHFDLKDAQEQIDFSGYTEWEVDKLESAFEDGENGLDMFKSMMRVIDVLGEIHEIDKEETKISKQKFEKVEL